MPAALLSDRAVLRVEGEAARAFLQGLVTCDVDEVAPGRAAYGALLTPQGKIIADFLLVQGENGAFLFDLPAALAADFAKRLTLYRLRAKITIAPVAGAAVVAVWGSVAAGFESPALAWFSDPRASELGERMILAAAPAGGETARVAYEAHRIACGVPAGGADFAYGDTFPHDANLDQLHGVDFEKGCYVGQEVVSRVQHRGSARRRIVAVTLEGSAKPGTSVTAGDAVVGTLGSVAGGRGLASLRTDKVADAQAAGQALRAGEAVVVLSEQ